VIFPSGEPSGENLRGFSFRRKPSGDFSFRRTLRRTSGDFSFRRTLRRTSGDFPSGENP
jgi:hypothetical protein